MNTMGRLVAMAVALMLSTACGDPASPSRDYSGSWVGTTAQGKQISFEVSGGNLITRFTVAYTLQGRFQNAFGSGTCTEAGSLSVTPGSPIAITDNTFRYDGSRESLAGTFESETSASGTASFQGSASCSGTSNTTWTASKR
ncbi:MAG: hypothetical protein HY704_12450 [Gemmatimonadetes bacterium]|nr:hypothetical protein [Gemmatimonadota bacterium]